MLFPNLLFQTYQQTLLLFFSERLCAATSWTWDFASNPPYGGEGAPAPPAPLVCPQIEVVGELHHIDFGRWTFSPAGRLFWPNVAAAKTLAPYRYNLCENLGTLRPGYAVLAEAAQQQHGGGGGGAPGSGGDWRD